MQHSMISKQQSDAMQITSMPTSISQPLFTNKNNTRQQHPLGVPSLPSTPTTPLPVPVLAIVK
jgi:hypothetical protein